AEAHIYTTHFLHPSNPCILKHRPSKPYRHPILDVRLTKHRILSEARTLVKCRREGVSVPGVLSLGAEDGWMLLEMVEGGTVKEGLRAWRGREKRGGEIVGAEDDVGGMEGVGSTGKIDDEVVGLMRRVGKAVGRMHEVGVVHGDLTTSNLMLRPSDPKAANGTIEEGAHRGQEPAEDGQEQAAGMVSLEGEIVLIDFGLAGQSVQDEDKAVDLYVLERAFGSTHPEVEEGFKEVLRAYGESYKGAKVVLKRLEEISRGEVPLVLYHTPIPNHGGVLDNPLWRDIACQTLDLRIRSGKNPSTVLAVAEDISQSALRQDRLAKWFTTLSPKDKAKIIKDVSQLVLSRRTRMCNFLEYKDTKVVYRRYASLFFIAGCSSTDNELITLEIVHRYVEQMDKYYGNVCELDIIFNFQKAYFILDELLLAGEMQESSKKNVLRCIGQQDSLEDLEVSVM
ncbi:MAG: hypothetical protein Q9210_006541, partial [Variospora velana]